MANSAVVGILRALLTADTAQFQSGLKGAASAARAWQKDFASIGQQATAVGKTLTAALTVPIIGIGAASVKSFMDFEDSFAGVRKTVDASEPEFAAMAKQFRELAKQIPINVNDLNRLGEAAGALGIPKAEIVDFSRVMALLGVTTDVTADQAASSIAKIQNVFGAAGKDTERFASTLVALGNEGASTEQEILALAQRIASAGNTVGLTQGQLLGFASAIANVGIEAEAGGTAMSKTFIDLSMAVSKGGADLASFAKVAGMSSAQFASAFRTDAAGAMQAFIEGLGKVKESGGDLNITLTDLGITEIRQSNLMRSLALSGDNVAESLAIQSKAWSDNTALTVEAEKRFATMKSQLTLLWNQVRDLGIELGAALMPAMKGLLEVVKGLLPHIESAAKWFGKLSPGMQTAIIGAMGFVAAAGPLLFVFGQIMTSTSTLIGLFTTKGLVMRVLTRETTKAAAATSAQSIALSIQAAALSVSTAATVAMTTAMAFWSSTAIVLGARMAATTALTAAHTAVASAAAAVTGVFTAAINALSGSSLIMGIRMAAGSSAMGAYSISAGLATGATVALGTALGALLYAVLPVGVAMAGWKLGKAAGEWSGLTDAIGKATAKLGEWIGLFEKGTAANYDSAKAAQQAALGFSDYARQVADEAKRLKDNLSGATVANEVEKLRAAFASLTPEQQKNAATMKRVGQEAEVLRQQGGQLHPELKRLADAFVKSQETAKPLPPLIGKISDSVKNLMSSLSGADLQKEMNDLAEAVKRLGGNISAGQLRELGRQLQDAAGAGAKLDPVLEKIRAQAEANAKGWAFFNELIKANTAAREDAAKRVEALSDKEVKKLKELMDARAKAMTEAQKTAQEAADAVMKSSMTATDYAIYQAGRQRDESLAAIEPLKRGIPGVYDIARQNVLKVYDLMVSDAKVAAQGTMGAFTTALSNLPSVILGAFQGGGGVGKAISSHLGAALFGPGSGINELLNKGLSSIATKIGGPFVANLASSLSAALPGLGALLGPAISGLIGKLFKGNTTKKGREQLAEMLGFGSLSELNTALSTMGEEGNRLLMIGLNKIGKNDTAALKQWEEDVKKLFETTKEKAKEAAEETARLTEELAGMKDELATLQSKSEPTWQDMLQAAKDFGVELVALGPLFQQQRMDSEAQKIIDAFDTLKRGGADLNGVIAGMSDELQAFVDESRTMGTKVPENMRPMLQAMVDNGQLLDEHGEKMKDLSGINFGEPIKSKWDLIKEAIDKLVLAIDALVLKLAGPVTEAVEDVKRKFLELPHEWEFSVKPNFGMGDASGTKLPSFAKGTRGQYVDFGSGTMAMLHGRERVVPEGELTAGGGTPSRIENILAVDGLEFARSMFPYIVQVANEQGI